MVCELTIEDLMWAGSERTIPLKELDKVVKIVPGNSEDTLRLVEELERRGIRYSFNGEGNYGIDMSQIKLIY